MWMGDLNTSCGALFFIQSQDNLSCERPQEGSSPISCSWQGHVWCQTKLLRALAILGLEIFKNRDYTTLLSNLCTILTGENKWPLKL